MQSLITPDITLRQLARVRWNHVNLISIFRHVFHMADKILYYWPWFFTQVGILWRLFHGWL